MALMVPTGGCIAGLEAQVNATSVVITKQNEHRAFHQPRALGSKLYQAKLRQHYLTYNNVSLPLLPGNE